MKPTPFTPLLLALSCWSIAFAADHAHHGATPAASTSHVQASHAKASEVPADKALEMLKVGNKRFVEGKVQGGRVSTQLRESLAKGQHPLAVIVTCSDSRLGPEIVFDQTSGDLFVVRCAGALVDDYDLGSIEYAIAHLGVHLVVVMGHERCGAVQSASNALSAPGHVGVLIKAIRPAVNTARHHGDNSLDGAIKENTREITGTVRKDLEKGVVKVVSAHFDMDTGAVEFFK